MSPGLKQSLVIAAFAGGLGLLIWARGRGGDVQSAASVENADSVSFPVPAMVSPLVSPLLSVAYPSPPTSLDTTRYNYPSPLQTPGARNNSSADNAGCCSPCGNQPNTTSYPMTTPVAARSVVNVSKKTPINTPNNTSYSSPRMSSDMTKILNSQFTSISGLRTLH